ncbi:MAG: response regulator, partial [Cytophagaceae bacterium]
MYFGQYVTLILTNMEKKFKALVVDDESDILELLRYNLEKIGVEVQCATNGAEAIEAAKNFKPQLILMDIMMPVMDGIEACRSIRDVHTLKDVVI